LVMGISKNVNPQNIPQIIPFPVENQPPQLSIDTDETDNRLFYIEHYSRVFRRCLSILQNEEDAKDIASDVFTKVQELKSKGKIIDHPKTFLQKMVENMIKNKKKSERREFIKLYDIATSGSLNWFKSKGEQDKKVWEAGIIDNGYEQVEAEIIVKTILAEQDETTCKIYFYYYHDSLTLEQIGEAVGLKKSAVHKRIKKLEKQVKETIRGIKK